LQKELEEEKSRRAELEAKINNLNLNNKHVISNHRENINTTYELDEINSELNIYKDKNK